MVDRFGGTVKEVGALEFVTCEQSDSHNCTATAVEAGYLRKHFHAPSRSPDDCVLRLFIPRIGSFRSEGMALTRWPRGQANGRQVRLEEQR